jgi:uncharacterized membrane protein
MPALDDGPQHAADADAAADAAATRALFAPPASRVLAAGAPRRWLARAGADLRAMPLPSLFYGAVFVAMAWALEHFLTDGAVMLALVTGFTLVAPFLATGLYALARERERGHPPSFAASLVAWRFNFGQVSLYGVILTLLLAAWIRVSVVIVALFFDQPGADAHDIIAGLLHDPQGWLFLAVYFAAGAGFAFLVFASSAVSVPLLLDRPLDVLSAMISSMQAVRRNLRVMLGWAALIALLMAFGMLAWFVPLLLIVPLLGYASWHAYRELLEPAD